MIDEKANKFLLDSVNKMTDEELVRTAADYIECLNIVINHARIRKDIKINIEIEEEIAPYHSNGDRKYQKIVFRSAVKFIRLERK